MITLVCSAIEPHPFRQSPIWPVPVHRGEKVATSPARCALSRYRSAVPDRLPSPGPSFLREHALDVGDRHLSVGMSRPTTTDDDWWLAIVWVADPEGIVSFVDLAPAAGPRPEPPLTRLGPSLAGALSGLILEDAGRLCIRLATVVPAEDPARPWRVPAAVRAAFRWEPMRAAAMRPNELAETVLAAFRRSAEALGRP
jgi:hypothetical protein